MSSGIASMNEVLGTINAISNENVETLQQTIAVEKNT
jgi:hypothetical protein